MLQRNIIALSRYLFQRLITSNFDEVKDKSGPLPGREKKLLLNIIFYYFAQNYGRVHALKKYSRLV
jgi:hypothetical protein